METAFVSSVTTAIFLLCYRLLRVLGVDALPAPSRVTAVAVVALVVLGPAVVAFFLARAERRDRVAAEADRALNLDARLVTAAELLERPQPAPLAVLLFRDVTPRVERAMAERVYPIPRIGYRAGFVFALLALAVVAMAPPGLSWDQVRKNPWVLFSGGDEEDDPSAEAVTPSRIDFEGMPREGAVPLTVYFIGSARGAVDAWEWEFGDGASVRGERQQEHTYTQPGRYTVVLRAGSTEAVKRDYIHVVAPDGDGGGGTAGITPMPGSVGQQGRPPQEGRPDVETVPHGVTPLDDGKKDMVEKDKAIYMPGEGGSGTNPSASEFPSAYEDYRRVAEETIGRERIPAPLADYVRKYFDRIRPR